MRSVAIFEAGKGLLVLAVGLGISRYLDHDLVTAGMALLDKVGLAQDGRIGSALLHLLASAGNLDFRVVVLILCLYAAMRFLEAYGLWYQRPWTPWYVSISTGSYLPIEVHHFIDHPRWMTAAIIVGNVALVVWLLRIEYRKHLARKAAATVPSAGPAPGIHSES